MIVPATVDHIRPIYDMMAAYFTEANEKIGKHYTWDKEKAVIYLGNLLWTKAGVNYITEKQEGFVLGTVAQPWFSNDTIAKPAVLYVKPEHRNGLIARSLLRKFEREARARGAGSILWEFDSGLSDPKMLSGLMEKMGYEYHGPIYRKIFRS